MTLEPPPVETFEIPPKARKPAPIQALGKSSHRLLTIGTGLALLGAGALLQRGFPDPRNPDLSQLATKVPAPAERLHISDTSANPGLTGTTKTADQPEVRRAELVQTVKRALPVIGAHYPASLPDGQRIWTTWKGTAARFSDLPAQPNIGDQFAVTEGPGHSWIWATPLGWNHPTWIDP